MLNEDWFENPPADYRVQPFWFWNGDMDEPEIARQIAEMKDKGVGGFFICARQGMTVPYLSRTWFDRVKFAVEAGRQAGLNVWLYDEYPYPSGIAGGEVTLEHPETVQRMLARTAAAAAPGERVRLDLPWGRVLAAQAVPVSADGVRDWERAVDVSPWIGSFQDETVFHQTGPANYSRKRYFTYHTVKRLDWVAPASAPAWSLTVITEQEIDDFKYYGTFVDPLHPAAVDTFMRLTHERYAQELKGELGSAVKGMFTDEVGLRAGKIPWSPQIPPYFEERCGYSLLDHLPCLFEDAGPMTAKVRYDFYQCIHLLLRERFHKRVAEWCEANGMDYVAEVPGVRMTTQLYSHIPGGDSAHEKLGRPLAAIMERYAHSLRHNPKMGSSLARQLGRTRALIECFHSIGWTMTLQDARWMIDWMAVLGTNLFNFHAFFYSIDGLRKHDAAPSQFGQNPYWRHFRRLGDYIGRIGYTMSRGSAVIDIAVLDPTTSLWTKTGNPFHQFGFAGADPHEKDKLERLKADWIAIQTALLQDRRDYDTLDPELLLRADIADGALHIGAARYRALVIPPVTNLEAAAWERVRAFAAAGGIVIAAGLLPCETIEADSGVIAEAAALFRASEGDADYYWHGRLPAAPARTGDDGAAGGSAVLHARTTDGPVAGATGSPADLDGRISNLSGDAGESAAGASCHAAAWRKGEADAAYFVPLAPPSPAELANGAAAGAAPVAGAEGMPGGEAAIPPAAAIAAAPAASGPASEAEPGERAGQPLREGQASGADAPAAYGFRPADGGMAPLLLLLDRVLPREAELTTVDGLTDGLLLQHRRIGEPGSARSDLLFIVNHEGRERDVCIRLSERSFGARVRWLHRSLETGELRPLAASGREARLSFAPYESHLLEIAGEADEPAADADADLRGGKAGRDVTLRTMASATAIEPVSAKPPTVQVDARGEWEFELEGSNTLRLGAMRMAIDAGDEGFERGWPSGGGAEAEWLDTEPKPWINQCADYRDILKHRLAFASRWFGTPFGVKIDYPAIVWYRIEFDAETVPAWCELTMDREAIAGEYRLFVNGEEWDGGRLRILPGRNAIVIRSVIARPHDGVVDPLYLHGPFGVRFAEGRRPVLTAMPQTGSPNDAVPAGAPHYSGTLVFRRTIAKPAGIDAEEAGTFRLTLSGLSEHFHDCAELLLNGRSLGVRPWTPYRWEGRSEWWRESDNMLEMRVDNPLSLRLDGTYFDYARHRVADCAEYAPEGDR